MKTTAIMYDPLVTEINHIMTLAERAKATVIAVEGVYPPVQWVGEGATASKEQVVFAKWDALSEQCRLDLMHSRPGSIIRCTEADWSLLQFVAIPPLLSIEPAGDGK